MKELIFLLLLLLFIINCQISPFEKINIEDLKKKKQLEENKKVQKNRRLNDGKLVFINPVSTMNIYIDSYIETLSIDVKAEGGEINTFTIPYNYGKLTILSCDLKMKNEQGQEIPINSELTNCFVDYAFLGVNAELKENYVLSVKAQLKYFYSPLLDNILLQAAPIEVPNTLGNTHCKYIFNVDANSVNLELAHENDKFKILNDSAYIYDDTCPDLIKITPRQITWNSYRESTEACYGLEGLENLNRLVHLKYYGGCNYNFTEDLSYTPIKNDTKEKLTITKDAYSFQYKHCEQPYNYFRLNLTFSSSSINWNVTDEDLKSSYKNTTTEKALSLVKEILSNDTSDKTDYYKIGKWIYNNIKYNKNHNSSSNVDDIIDKREGVCHHFTLLYNALLNSIGIKALYATGDVIHNLTTFETESHAWTVAEINGKWIGLDATWDLLGGRLPQCHLFKYFEGGDTIFVYTIPYEPYMKQVVIKQKDETKFVEIVNITEKKNSVSDNPQNGEGIKSKLYMLFNLIMIIILLI